MESLSIYSDNSHSTDFVRWFVWFLCDVTFSEFQLFSGWFISTIKWEGWRPIWKILTVVGNLLHHQWRVSYTRVSQMSLEAGLNCTTGIRIRKFISSFPWTSEWIPRSSFLCFNVTSATLHFATFLVVVGRRKSSNVSKRQLPEWSHNAAKSSKYGHHCVVFNSQRLINIIKPFAGVVSQVNCDHF